MISCRDVAKLLMSDELTTLSRWRRLEVRMHLSMCGLCSRLERQLKQIQAAARAAIAGEEADADLEERVLRRLRP